MRHLNATRLLACGAVLRPVETLLTKACAGHRDEEERRWLTTVRALLAQLRSRSAEVGAALKEFDETRAASWRPVSSQGGVRTEWRPGDDGSLWVRMDGELTEAELTHAVAVSYEADLWPRWAPLCSGAEVVNTLSPLERVIWVQFDLGPVLRRGAVLHWSLSDSLAERQSLLILGASLGEGCDVTLPPAAAGVALADFRAVKILISPRARRAARIRWVANVDLRVPSMPSSMVTTVTKKIGGAILNLLVREAQKATREADAENAGHAAGEWTPSENPHLRRASEHPEFYEKTGKLFERHFEFFGEGGSESEDSSSYASTSSGSGAAGSG